MARGVCSGSPQPCRVSGGPRAVPAWKDSLEGKPVVKQIILLGTQSCGDPRAAADTRARGIRESRSCVALKPQVRRQKASWWPAAAGTLSKPRERTPSATLSRAHNRLSPGKGCVDAAWVVSCCDCHAVGLLFSPFGGCCFSFLSIQFCLVQQPGAWQGPAAIPSRPFAEQAAPST